MGFLRLVVTIKRRQNFCFHVLCINMSQNKWESVLNSRILSNHFKELCKNFSSPYKESNMWINRQKWKYHNDFIRFLTQTVKLITEGRIDCETFKSEIKKLKDLDIIIIWYLEFFRIMTIREVIEFHECNNDEEVLQHIAEQIFQTLLNYKNNHSELRKKILCSYMKTLLEFLNNDLKTNVGFREIQMKLIQRNIKECYSCEGSEIEKYLEVSHFNEIFSNLECNSSLIKYFYQQILIVILESSQHTIKSVFKLQEKIKNNVMNKNIWHFFVAISKYCDLDFMIQQFESILLQSAKGIDWNHMLCLITFVGKNYTEGWRNLKILTNLIIKVAFQNLESRLLSHAFVIARQGCFEKGNDSFPTYLQWFSSTFSSESKKLLNSQKICSFFFDFLTELIPYEPTYYSKVHINKVPWVPLDCQPISHEYIEMVKTHLGSLNVSVELGICENTTSKSAAVFDVENVIKHFERTNDILNSVFQASLFCKEYYEKKFLVELLSKFEGKKSVRHKLILKLQSLGKIPNSMFKVYKNLEKKAK